MHSPQGLRARINATVNSLSLTGRIVFYTLAIIMTASTLSFLWRLNNYFMVSIPARGGSITEGILGLPRFINPVLAITDGDKDITALVYSGLMRQNNSGKLIPDLAESYSVSADANVYTFVLKNNIFFHDNTPVTADDVVFTISQIQNPNVKSPKRANWDGITVEKIDDRTVRFTLKQPYAPFLENTTVGILPKHAWTNTTPEAFSLDNHNSAPIGSGPYILKTIKKDDTGMPISYTLKANDDFVLGRPYIKIITFKFYSTEKALEEAYLNGEIDSLSGVSPETALKLKARNAVAHTAPLPRVFGVFFNETANEALADLNVRRALDVAVDQDYIVDTVLQGFGTPLHGPVPYSFLAESPALTKTTASRPTDDRLAEASILLDKAGWVLGTDSVREKKNKQGTTTLTFSISTSDAPELKAVAEILKTQWQRIGADVTVKVFESGNLNQSIIRPRKYDALLFGQIVNKDLDLYAFWHSSQRTDPGLNIALYSNSKADKLLEDLRTTSDENSRLATYTSLATHIASDTPAVFLYSPDLIYMTSPRIQNIELSATGVPSDRFNNLHTWHIDTDKVWTVFARTKE